MLDVSHYLDRIGFKGHATNELETLRKIHRCHVMNIPYENLDVFVGRGVSIEIEPIFEKLVVRRRGGWCYEMNGLLAWALEELGFRVTRMAGGVRRAQAGDSVVGNHLVLSVHLDEDYLADAGFGDGLIEPVAFEETRLSQGPSAFQLEKLDETWWRFHGDPRSGELSFDFERKPADRQVLQNHCDWLQSAPESIFVQNAVAQRHLAGSHVALRGCVLRYAGARQELRELKSADEYLNVLETVFDLNIPEMRDAWPRIVARHKEVFPDGVPGTT